MISSFGFKVTSMSLGCDENLYSAKNTQNFSGSSDGSCIVRKIFDFVSAPFVNLITFCPTSPSGTSISESLKKTTGPLVTMQTPSQSPVEHWIFSVQAQPSA